MLGSILPKKGMKHMEQCNLCPRRCSYDRTVNTGICLAGPEPVVAKIMLHTWEEPFISGETGTGALFFSGCSLRCVYCQNSAISHTVKGQVMTEQALIDAIFRLKAAGAVTISLITAAHFTDRLVPVLREVRQRGLDLPIVWNSSGYESVETLQRLEGLVDVYLPDFKYMDPDLARRYSRAGDYPKVAKAALAEMYRQTGPLVFAGDRLVRGMVVRHLVLPGLVHDSEAVLAYLHETYGNDIFLSIMNQYTPAGDLSACPELDRRLTEAEYEAVVDFALVLGVTNALVQDSDSQSADFTPDFDVFALDSDR